LSNVLLTVYYTFKKVSLYYFIKWPEVIVSWLKGFVIILFLVLLSYFSYAEDSIKTKIKTTYTNIEQLESRQDSFFQIDTSLYLFHEYNPANSYNRFYTNLGASGSPIKKLVFEPEPELGFDFGLHHFDLYKYSYKTIKYYRTYTPFSEFFYTQGANQMQFFNATHARNIFPVWNVAIFYKGILSDGIYYNQQNKIKTFGATSSIKTRNSRYQAYITAFKNSFIVHENGGITSDSLFESYSNSDKKRTEVYLGTARQEYVERNYYLTQLLNLGRAKDMGDTLTKFSPDRNPFKKPFYLLFTAGYTQREYKFITMPSAEPGYYVNIFFDSANTHDKFSNHFYQGKLQFFKSFGKLHKDSLYGTNIYAGVKYFNGDAIQQDSIKTIYKYWTCIASVDQSLLFMRLFLNGEYILSGDYSGDYNLKEFIRIQLFKNFEFEAGASQTLKSPEFLQTNMYSNHLQWKNDFIPTYSKNYFASLINLKYQLKLNFTYKIISNLIYFTQDMLPAQYDQDISYYAINLKKEFKLGKFHFDNNLLYQSVSNPELLALPSWVINNCTYYENNLFKNHLLLEVGLDINIYDDYYSDAYYAPFSLLYKQEKVLIKSYPRIDVFLSGKIKKVRFFLKYEHINQGWPEYFGYTAPHYPIDPRAFRFGFNWMFFD
jgi:hypothetical protein